jgi:hypothetical protein
VGASTASVHVAADAQLAPQLKSGDAVRVGGGDVRGKEPCFEWQMAAMHDRAFGDCTLRMPTSACCDQEPNPSESGKPDR